MKKTALLVLITAAFIIFGCSEDDNPVKPADEQPDNFVTTNIKEEPSFFSLEEAAPVQTFDIVFHIENRSPDLGLNSGPNGSAGVGAKDLGVADFNTAVDIKAGFTPDTGDSAVIGDSWFTYDFTTHTVASKNHIYLVRGADTKVYKLRVDGYTQNTWNITFSPVDDDGVPTNTQTLDISATEDDPAYFSLAQGSVITPGAWDIAFTTILLYIPEMSAYIQNPAALINAAQGAEVAMISGTSYNDLNAVPASAEFKTDTETALAIGDLLFDYNPQNHKLSPPDVVYAVKTTGGKMYKLAVTSYYHPETGESGYVNFRAAAF